MVFKFFKRYLKVFRMWLLLNIRYKLGSVGKNIYFGRRIFILRGCLDVGDHVFIGGGCWIGSKVRLGNFVMFAARVSVVGGDHRINLAGTPMIHSGRDVNRPTIIEDDVWVGYGVIIMHGRTIGEGAIVAAGSVVVNDVLPYTIVAGNPAKKIRERFPNEKEREKHKMVLESYRNTRKIEQVN
jgi:chloramphenicol O-acetyltransferase type B